MLGVHHGIQVYNKLARIKYGVLCQSVVINYVSEHQLPHVEDASHTTPTTHVNWGPILLKLIGWRYCLCFKWVSCIPGTTAQTLALNQDLPQVSQEYVLQEQEQD